jgi:translation initiation factor 4G
MGPGGSLSRTGEESGASSRTGTPPQQKEKESATSANAFRYVFYSALLDSPMLTLYSLLAGLGSGESEHPASPPSVSNSPELSKAAPASSVGKPEDKESES